MEPATKDRDTALKAVNELIRQKKVDPKSKDVRKTMDELKSAIAKLGPSALKFRVCLNDVANGIPSRSEKHNQDSLKAYRDLLLLKLEFNSLLKEIDNDHEVCMKKIDKLIA
jgi:hypothetical protein